METYLEIMIFPIISLTLLFFLLNHTLKTHRHFVIPLNWPLVGMLPHLLLNLHRFYDWSVDILPHVHGTFIFKGPWLGSMDQLVTFDPANVRYIMSKNFANFPKGIRQAKTLEILGDGIFNVDFEPWRRQRRILHSFLAHPRFHKFLVQTIERKVDIGLVPVLEHAYKEGQVADLQDLFQRFTFDMICTLVAGRDTCRLSIGLPDAPFCKALDDVEEVLFYRNVVPETVWKMQRWLGVGEERRLKEAWETLDGFLYRELATKREDIERGENMDGVDFVTLCLKGEICIDHDLCSNGDKFWRDMFLNLMIAGRDTTSVALTWFFWLLFKNPSVESKVREEVESILSQKSRYQCKPNCNLAWIEEVNELVYLHGALCEALRLYPSVPFQEKVALEPDVLPSGHRVAPNMRVLIHLYSMGREKSTWGDDCFEFKPERWITDRGKTKHFPSYKFFAFNTGPRACLGKDMAFTQMKAIASTILLSGYHFHVVEEHKVKPNLSFILRAKHGLKAKVLKATS